VVPSKKPDPNFELKAKRIKPVYQVGEAAQSDVLKRNSAGKFQYKATFTTDWSKSYRDEKRYYDEWVIVVATKKPIRWISSYDYVQFREKLREIPADEIRKERLGYQLYK